MLYRKGQTELVKIFTSGDDLKNVVSISSLRVKPDIAKTGVKSWAAGLIIRFYVENVLEISFAESAIDIKITIDTYNIFDFPLLCYYN